MTSVFPFRLVLPVLFFICLPLAGCGDSGKGTVEKKPAPVRVAAVVSRDVPRELKTVGNVEAVYSVSVQSQVGGQIVEVPVTAGQEVEAGEVLFRLDPRPFDAAVAEAAARLVRGRALADKARKDRARYASLITQDFVSRESYDQIVTVEKTAKADIAEAEAALRAAELNREYSVIKAPVGGKLGDILVRLGNVISANDQRALVVINSLRPAEVSFTVAERYLPLIRERMGEGPLTVAIQPEGDSGAPATGTVTAVDNAVDRATGSIRLQAMSPNNDNRLWPGQFVRVALVTGIVKNAVTVPARAVQEGLNGSYVYLAVPEGPLYKVSPRPVVVEPAGDDSVMVTSGLAAGDVVITDGQLGLVPDALARDIGQEREAETPGGEQGK